MTLLHCITGLATGGAQQQLLNLIKGGLADRLDVHVVSLTEKGAVGGQIEELGVPVHVLNMRRGLGSPSSVLPFRRFLAKFRPRIIQGWMYHGNLAALAGQFLSAGRPSVAWNVRHSLHDLTKEKWSTQLAIRCGRLLSPRIDAIVYNSNVSRKHHEAFGFKQNNGIVISNGFDLERLRPNKPLGSEVRASIGIPHNALVVGHIARLHPAKGHDIFSKASISVAERMPRVHFVLVGAGVDSRCRLAELVPAVVRSRFHFLGERRDIPRVLPAIDVLCQSSWTEAFPNVLGEAMACGIPCVATDVGESSVIIGAEGRLVPSGDAKGLATALIELLSLQPAIRERMGRRASARIAASFALEKVVKQYVQLYQDMLE